MGSIDWHFLHSKHASPSAKTILLLHGTGSSSHSWGKLFSRLSKNFHVIAPDLPGHGFTFGARKHHAHVDVIAQELQNFLAAIGSPHPEILIGHSAGANCALALHHLSEHSAEHIIGLNPAFVNPPSSYSYFLSPLMNPITTSGLTASFLAYTASHMGAIDKLLDSTNSTLSDNQRDCYRTLYQKQVHIYGALNFIATMNVPALIEKSSNIQTPMTFLISEDDPWVPKAALVPILKKHFPNATRVVDAGGHLLHEAEPKRVAEFIQLALGANSSPQEYASN